MFYRMCVRACVRACSEGGGELIQVCMFVYPLNS